MDCNNKYRKYLKKYNMLIGGFVNIPKDCITLALEGADIIKNYSTPEQNNKLLFFVLDEDYKQNRWTPGFDDLRVVDIYFNAQEKIYCIPSYMKENFDYFMKNIKSYTYIDTDKISNIDINSARFYRLD